MPRVLLVNDDIAEISAVKRVLLRGGHQTVLATNSSDARAAIAQEMPRLVLISATCENGEGLALAQQLADHSHTASLPLILLGEAPEAPASAVQLPRPIDPGQLAESLQAALGAPGRPASTPPAHPVARIPSSHPAPASLPRGRPVVNADRRAAADALRQRAEELRRAAATRAATPADPAAEVLAPPAPPKPELPQPRAGGQRSGAARPVAGELPALTRDEQETEGETPRQEGEDLEAQRRARIEEELSQLVEEADQEERRRAEEEQRRLEEERRHAEQERLQASQEQAREQEIAAIARAAEEEAQRRAEVEAATRASQAAARAAEAIARAAEEEARRQADARARAREAEARHHAEAGARQRAEEEARRQAEEAVRRLAEEEVQRQAEAEAAARAGEEESRRLAEEQARALAETRRRAEEEARRRIDAAGAARAAAEEARRRAEAEAVSRAAAEEARWRAEMEKLAQAEAAERRHAEEEEQASRLAEERSRQEAEERAADRAAQEEAARQRVRALAMVRKSPPPQSPARLPEPPAPPRLGGGNGSTGAVAPEQPAPAASAEPPPPRELASGDLAQLPMPRLLALLANARLAGRLDFGGNTPRSLYLEEGRVVGATSAAPHERVEEVALRLGLVTREQHRLVATGATNLASRRAALLLLERGWLKPTELTSLVRRRTEEVVFALFGETQAPFQLARARVPADERIALDRGTLELAVEGVRRKWLAPQLDAVLGGAGSLLAPGSQAPPAAELGLTAGEQRALELADGLRALDEILADSPLEPLATRQVLAAAVMVGALLVRFHAGDQAAAEAPSIDLARVQEKLDQVRRADYFAILGLSRRCTPYEIREAAERLAAEFDGQRFADVAQPGLGERLAEIRRVVAEALEVLSDDALRGEYLVALGDETA